MIVPAATIFRQQTHSVSTICADHSNGDLPYRIIFTYKLDIMLCRNDNQIWNKVVRTYKTMKTELFERLQPHEITKNK